MNGNCRTDGDCPTPLGIFAAVLSVAAYPIALEHGMGDSWVDLEIDLWLVLAETAKRWAWEGSRAGCPGGYEAWRECFLAALTDAAYRTALRYGVQGSFLDAELGLYQAFRPVIEAIGRETMLCETLGAGPEGQPLPVSVEDT
jgi:hypothetical protein